jgi:hypothetical protein
MFRPNKLAKAAKGLTSTQVPGSNLGWGIILTKIFVVFSEYLKADSIYHKIDHGHLFHNISNSSLCF